jgi:hypothetical protein
MDATPPRSAVRRRHRFHARVAALVEPARAIKYVYLADPNRRFGETAAAR